MLATRAISELFTMALVLDQKVNYSGLYSQQATTPIKPLKDLESEQPKPVEQIGGTDDVIIGTGSGNIIPEHIGGEDVSGGPKNVLGHEKYKEVLNVTEQANPLVNNLKETGKLPDNFLLSVKGRVWYEADVELVGNMSRSKQPGSRLLYSNDGLMYITTDHYRTFHLIRK